MRAASRPRLGPRKSGHGKCHRASFSNEFLITVNRRRNKDTEDAMDVDEDEDEDEDDPDSIMDEDESASSRDEQGDDGSDEVDGERTPSSSKQKSKEGKKSRRKSDLDMAALTDEQAALAALESNQLLHLRLRKRYYAEALNFIRQVEEAAQIIFQLLGSTHKAEVLEAMEFFRVAHEYQLDNAAVSGGRYLGILRWVANEHADWHQEDVAPDLVEGQQLDVRRWEGAQRRPLASA
jgi:condensin complex subunit 1